MPYTILQSPEYSEYILVSVQGTEVKYLNQVPFWEAAYHLKGRIQLFRYPMRQICLCVLQWVYRHCHEHAQRAIASVPGFRQPQLFGSAEHDSGCCNSQRYVVEGC
jgi:hypothetical protein